MEKIASICLLLFLVVMVANHLTVATNSTNIKILILYFEAERANFIASKLAAYGEIRIKKVGDVASYNLDYFRQFDVFITFNDNYFTASWGDIDWSRYPKLAEGLLNLVYEGRSLLAIYVSQYETCPADSWVSANYVECENVEVEFEILPSEITEGVRSIKYKASECLVLYGRYPVVLTPKRYSWPDPQAALVIYGSHGNGKYVALSQNLLWAYGDVSILISNIMYWLTNRDIPPPPPPLSVIQLDQKVEEINATINMLSSKLTYLRDSIDQLNKQVPQLNEITSQVSQLSQSISALTNQVNKLSNDVAQIRDEINKSQMQQTGQTASFYTAIFAVILSIAALLASIKRR